MNITQKIGMKNVFLSFLGGPPGWGGGVGGVIVYIFILILFFMKNEIRDYFYEIA